MKRTGLLHFKRQKDACIIRKASQDDDSDGRKRCLKRPETAIKRRFTALNFSVFYRNPSSRITGRFFR